MRQFRQFHLARPLFVSTLALAFVLFAAPLFADEATGDGSGTEYFDITASEARR